MFIRKVYPELLKWKDSPFRKPLILRGARQVGKTTLVKMFSEEFHHFIYLNLDLHADYDLFDQSRDVKSFLQILLLRENKKLLSGKTLLLFIDEIQSSSKAINMLRYFYEELPEIHVIAAGSLLETLLRTHEGFPVGRVEYLILRPFSFEEFVSAMGHDVAVDALNTVPALDYSHDILMSLFKKYCLIGGMPEVVKTYLKTDDLVVIGKVFQNLITAYLEDVEKYSNHEHEIRVIRHCIEASLRLAGERIKFEGFGGGSYKSKDVSHALRMIEKTMLLSLIYPTETTKLPLLENKAKSPKLQLLDTGLLNYFSGIQLQLLQNPYIEDVYEGKVAEHIVGQEIHALSSSPLYKNHFWAREKKQSDAEVDYIIQFNDLIIPIEVKSGKTGRLRSLMQFVDQSPHPYAVRFFSGKFSLEDHKTISGKSFKLLNMPFYLASKLPDYLKLMINE